MINKLVLYGAGKRCKMLCKILRQFNVEIMAVVDSNADKWGSNIEGIQVEPPEKLRKWKDMNWCITLADVHVARMIQEELGEVYQFDLEKEVGYHELILALYKGRPEVREKIQERSVKGNNSEEAILFSSKNGLALGGVQAWIISLCELLIKNRKENIYIISNKGTYDVPVLLENHIIYVDIDQQERFSIRSILNLIEAIMEKLPCTIITTHADEIMLAAYLIKCYYPNMIKIIATIHNGNGATYNAYMDFRECPDIYIGVSQDIRTEMIRRGIKSEKIYAMSIPFACDEELNRTYTEDSQQPICIGYAGRMDGMKRSQKRMDLFLRLIMTLEEKKVDFKIELAGDGPVRKEMEEFVRFKGLDSKVSFLGRLERSEIPLFWKRQDICINIADYEGRNISITEAMGNGAVPVVTATSGVREDITDSVNGYVIPLGDYYTMAKRIEYLAEHRELLNKMGRLAHDAVYPKSLMEPHLKFWEDILSHKR